ncbi:unnamed protein product [Sphagnum jensenii]|uniref:LEC14B homolog n=1 Tax=Sphagnum jensenii TaxID=128206 RepID=A0ABP0X121_9BRYO
MAGHGGRGSLSNGILQSSSSNESASGSHHARRRTRNRANSQDPMASSEESDEDDPEYVGDEEENADDNNDDEEEIEFSAEEDEYDVSLGPLSVSSGSEGSEVLPVPLDHDHLTHATALRNAASAGSARLANVKPCELVNTQTMLAGREFNVSKNGRFSRAECCHVASRYLPTDGPLVVEQLNSRAYIGQFSKDGTLFVAGFQDRRIRIYNVDRGWTVQKDILARNLRWTVTDTALSPDQRFLVYASITPIVHLVNVGNESGGVQSLANITDIHEGLNFSTDVRGENVFGLWTLQFSHDGRELVAGSSDKSIYVYDLEANKPVLRIVAHKDDVNAVVFADESCHLIYSGSDDHICKIWDRRCFAQRNKPAGQLVGHLEGITFIDSRGDGRYFISNGKDQTIKLWDIRKMTSGSASSRGSKHQQKIPTFRWDYRWMDYPGMGRDVRHPYDQSLMTYKGHLVLRTLIRCYFSPLASTGQKYIYTGSHDGCVYIFDMVTGKQVGRLIFHRGTVRDCSWHPTQPMLVSSSWDGNLAKWEHLHGDKPQVSKLCSARFSQFEVDNQFDSE